MGLVYRAIWEDSIADPIEFGLARFRDWVGGKTGLEVPHVGAAVLEGGAADVLVRRASVAGISALRARWQEERLVERWTSTFTIIDEPLLMQRRAERTDTRYGGPPNE